MYQKNLCGVFLQALVFKRLSINFEIIIVSANLFLNVRFQYKKHIKNKKKKSGMKSIVNK